MKAIIITPENRETTYPNLFGSQTFKNLPLFIYAEHLFYNAMSQFVPSYTGGYFDYIHIAEADIEIESSNFIPLINSDEAVSFTNPYGTSATLSLKAATLVSWIFTLEQIAHSANKEVMNRIFNVIQGIKYCYSALEDKDGRKIFSENDYTSIYKLTN